MVGVLQMVSSAGSSFFQVLKQTFGAARCRVQRIDGDVQQALECSSGGSAAVDGASSAWL